MPDLRKETSPGGLMFAPKQDITLIRRTLLWRKDLDRQKSEVKRRLDLLRDERKRLEWKGRWKGRAKKAVEAKLRNHTLKQKCLESSIKDADTKLKSHAAVAYKHLFGLFHQVLPRELRDIVYVYLKSGIAPIGHYSFRAIRPGCVTDLNTSELCNLGLLANKTPICGDRSAHPHLWREMAECLFNETHLKFHSIYEMADFFNRPNTYGYGVTPATFLRHIEIETSALDTTNNLATSFNALVLLKHPRIAVTVRMFDFKEPALLHFLQDIKATWDHLKSFQATTIDILHMRPKSDFSFVEQDMLSVLEGPNEDMGSRLHEVYRVDEEEKEDEKETRPGLKLISGLWFPTREWFAYMRHRRWEFFEHYT